MVLIAPSLLSADMAHLGDEVKKLELAKADLLHFDVMDGHFVPNMTFGPIVLKALKKHTHLLFDVHLMVDNPQKFIPWFADAGADIITFHSEATTCPADVYAEIKKYDIKAGISICPDTPVDVLNKFEFTPDMILIMSVNPGFGGQDFDMRTIHKIEEVRNMFGDNIVIEVDGGINPKTASLCIQAGANILVSGTSVFKNGTYAENIRAIRGETK